MQISWKGQNCFHIISQRNKAEAVSIVIDPPDEASGLKPFSSEADLVLLTGPYPGAALKSIKGDPFIAENPGEYEIKEVFFLGIPVDSKEERTIYSMIAEEIKICHLGSFNGKELTNKEIEEIGDIDILMVPVGGNNVLNAEAAKKIVLQIEPRIVIPMRYKTEGSKEKLDDLGAFLKAMGVKEAETVNKLTIKKKDLVNEETKVIVLTP